MRVQSLYIRGYRSAKCGSMPGCGGLNVLIGKNNAGKSTFLSAISRVVEHLRRGTVAAPLRTIRAKNEFTDGDMRRPFQIGIQFELPQSINEELRRQLKAEAPQFERSIDQIAGKPSLSFILCGARARDESAFQYVAEVSVGPIDDSADDLKTSGFSLVRIPVGIGEELYRNTEEAAALARDDNTIEQVLANRERFSFFFREQPQRRGMIAEYITEGVRSSRSVRERINLAAASADTIEQFTKSLHDLRSSLREQAEAVEERETSAPMEVFAGSVKTPPKYVRWLMEQFGGLRFLEFHERKHPIGREEATALLQMKVSRGGAQRLASVQQTVQALLGVRLDAFQSEATRPSDSGAELDVDEFLVEANGAGIREALRIVLDIELKAPELVLIEEPEVHLHPGLERALESYLRAKSLDAGIQFFLTTHSTNFIDAMSFQNVYLISRDPVKKTLCHPVDPNGAHRIPAELGLRLSTVFMFDRLVFVEGPTDEAVLRAFASLLGLDLAQACVGFVQMGGVRNFAHFAADATLDLLSRRNISMWFVTDRDERDDADVQGMAERLGERASLVVLKRRELENYLLEPNAIGAFISRKLAAAKSDAPCPTREAVAHTIRESAKNLKDEVIRLRLQKRVLKPVYLERKGETGTPPERIQKATAELKSRLARLDDEIAGVTAEVNSSWPDSALAAAPGCAILEAVAKSFGVTFNKLAGDSVHIARAFNEAAAVDPEIVSLLKDVCRS
jgi:putative ATP-dependent endonuclease of OLD family